jgi:hypothetical protein
MLEIFTKLSCSTNSIYEINNGWGFDVLTTRHPCTDKMICLRKVEVRPAVGWQALALIVQ